jgi:hypothetical protein
MTRLMKPSIKLAPAVELYGSEASGPAILQSEATYLDLYKQEIAIKQRINEATKADPKLAEELFASYREIDAKLSAFY